MPFPRYEQPSSYRPAPVNLSQVFLNVAQEELVNLLAENEHNVWAKERIKHGWTYGAQQVYVLCCAYCTGHALLGRSLLVKLRSNPVLF